MRNFQAGVVAFMSERRRYVKQAGERGGAVNGPHLDTQRPEMPAAQGFSGSREPSKSGAELGVSASGAAP